MDAGLKAVRDWIREQGVPDELVAQLDDSGGNPVEVAQLFDAVKAFADSRVVEQLVVYFCGHGVVNDGSELWLLSGAPDDPSAAVNVAKSVRLAERGVIPHIVLLSDACRSQAASLQFGEVTGSSIFPNPNTVGSRKVDVFYATRVGENAHQVAEEEALAAVGAAAKTFHPVWTEVVAEALRGTYPEVQRETVQLGGTEVDVVRPWSLHQALPTLLANRLNHLGVLAQVAQFPDSRITSNPTEVWLSQLPHLVAPTAPAGAPDPPLGPAAPAGAPPPAPAPPPAAGPPPAVEEQVQDGEAPEPPRRYRGRKRRRLPWRKPWSSTPAPDLPAPPMPAPPMPVPPSETGPPAPTTGASPSPPPLSVPPRPPSRMVDHDELRATRAASHLTTAALAGGGEPLTALAVREQQDVPEPMDITALARGPRGQLAGVGDFVLVVPNFGDRGCTAVLDESGAEDLRWHSRGQGGEVETVVPEWRSSVASRSRFGLQWLNDPAEAVARAVEAAGEDPSIAVYVAYGLVESGHRAHVLTLLDGLQVQGSPVPYDVALLAEDLSAFDGPPFPLMSAGWSLLGDDGVAPMPTLPGRSASLWTAFRADAADLAALEQLLTDRPH
ncbi:hypothetical protein N803_05990 [Knoellia subterranea KCTC 19937]|uniref:Uncharacterized protein n=1 Tax=Knoellia subterranea KCTC 19937 TaxID=1385521 RepID=A0A0A0JHX7_9MICO|nr:hypothetical protein N803_05990 [Knoellia subterranea KCTC 19937]